jgi:hypothetical protein
MPFSKEDLSDEGRYLGNRLRSGFRPDAKDRSRPVADDQDVTAEWLLPSRSDVCSLNATRPQGGMMDPRPLAWDCNAILDEPGSRGDVIIEAHGARVRLMREPVDVSRPILGCGIDYMRDQRATGASAATTLIDIQILKVAAVRCIPAGRMANMVDQTDGHAVFIAGDCTKDRNGGIEQARPCRGVDCFCQLHRIEALIRAPESTPILLIRLDQWFDVYRTSICHRDAFSRNQPAIAPAASSSASATSKPANVAGSRPMRRSSTADTSRPSAMPSDATASERRMPVA